MKYSHSAIPLLLGIHVADDIYHGNFFLLKEKLKSEGSVKHHFVMPLANNISLKELSSIIGSHSGVRDIDGKVFLDDIQVVRGMSLEVMAVADVAVV